MVKISYGVIFGDVVTRTFPTRARAEQWARQIGKPALIQHIQEVN